MKKLIAFVGAALLASYSIVAFAGSTGPTASGVQQSGSVVAGHGSAWVAKNQLGDSGFPAGQTTSINGLVGTTSGSGVTITGSGTTGSPYLFSSTATGSFTYPGAGIPNSTGIGWGTSYGVSGSGNVALTNGPTFTGTVTLPAGQVVNGVTLTTGGSTSNFLNANGTYSAPSGGGTVSSVFSRTGAVTAQTGDYSVSQITGAAPLASPTFTGTVTLPAAQVVNGVTLTTTGSTSTFLNSAGTYSSAAGGVSSVFGRAGAVTATTGDYSVSQITGAAPLASPTFTGTVTLPAAQVVNGVTLQSGGSTSNFLNANGTYSAVSGGYNIGLGSGLTNVQGVANSTPLSATATSLYTQTIVNSYSGNHTVSASESAGLDVLTTGSFTFTVLAPTSTGNGTAPGNSYGFLNSGTGALSLTISGSGAIQGCPLTSSSVVLSQYQNAWLTSDGTNYQCSESSAGGTSGASDTPVTLTISGSNFQPSMAANKNFTLTLSHGVSNALINPSTNPALGQSGNFNITQSSTGSDTLSLDSNYYTANNLGLSLSTTANAIDHFRYYAVDATHIQIDPVTQNLKSASLPNNLALDGTTSSTSAVTSSPATVSLSTTTSNDLIILYGTNRPTGSLAVITGVTDTAGLSWSLRKALVSTQTVSGQTQDNEVWWAKAPSPLSSDTITVAYGSGVMFVRLNAFGIKGVNSSPFDPNGSLPAGSYVNSLAGSSLGNTISTTNSDTMLLGFLGCTGSANCTTITPPAGSTNIFTQNGILSVDYIKYTAAQSSITPTYSWVAGAYVTSLITDAVTQ